MDFLGTNTGHLRDLMWITVFLSNNKKRAGSIRNELSRHRDAFELYFQLKQSGSTTKASVEQVASKCNFNVTTIWKWKKLFNWDRGGALRVGEIQKTNQKYHC